MTQNKHFPLIAICLTIVICFFFASRTGIYIKSISGVDSHGRISNIISVSGDGMVTSRPDMVEISVSVKNLSPTSRQALDKVNQKVAQVIEVLKNNGIPESDYKTTGLNVYTEYDYSDKVRRIIGQNASQSISIKVKKIDDKATKAAKIIDDLSAISDIEMNGISFDIEDKTKFYTQARELAFKKAQQKAEELAKLSGVKLGKPVSITDSTYDVTPRPYYSNVAELKVSAMGGGADNTQISTGDMSISAALQIMWSIE